MTSNLMCVCATCNKISNAEFKWVRYFVNEVETQLREKPLRGSQTQDIHYSWDKASYKAVALTYPYAVVVPWTLTHNPMRMPPNQVTYLKGSSMESFTSPSDRLHTNTTTTLRQRLESKRISIITPKIYSLSTTEFNTEFLQITCLEASNYRL